MDICDIVVNHFYDQIIERKGDRDIRLHHINNQQPGNYPSTYQVIVDQQTIDIENGASLIEQSPFLSAMNTNRFELRAEIVSVDALQLLIDYTNAVDPPTVPDNVYFNKEKGQFLYRYIDTLYTGDAYLPITLFSINDPIDMRSRDKQWFKQFLFKEDITYDENSSIISILNVDNVQRLLNAVDTADYLGIEPFFVYAFVYLYMISISMSCEERSFYFGHPFFLLPIEGWEHKFRNMYNIPFIPEPPTYTDTKYEKIRSQMVKSLNLKK